MSEGLNISYSTEKGWVWHKTRHNPLQEYNTFHTTHSHILAISSRSFSPLTGPGYSWSCPCCTVVPACGDLTDLAALSTRLYSDHHLRLPKVGCVTHAQLSISITAPPIHSACKIDGGTWIKGLGFNSWQWFYCKFITMWGLCRLVTPHQHFCRTDSTVYAEQIWE